MDWNEDSTTIDQRLGFRVAEIESELLKRARALDRSGDHHTWGSLIHQGNQTWVGLHPETIQTPYRELAEIVRLLPLKSGDRVVDFGAGYGRLGLVLKDLYPDVLFRGIEFVPERVAEGKRVFLEQGMDPASLYEGDLTSPDFFPEEAQHYFIYDFGKVPHIRSLLDKLGTLADQKRFTVIGRGKGIRSLIAHEYHWLTSFHEAGNYSLYSL